MTVQAKYKDKLEAAHKRGAEQRARGQAAPALLGRDDLRQHYGISYSRQHLWRLIKKSKKHRFPRPVALGPGRYARKAWRREDVEAWLAALPYLLPSVMGD